MTKEGMRVVPKDVGLQETLQTITQFLETNFPAEDILFIP